MTNYVIVHDWVQDPEPVVLYTYPENIEHLLDAPIRYRETSEGTEKFDPEGKGIENEADDRQALRYRRNRDRTEEDEKTEDGAWAKQRHLE